MIVANVSASIRPSSWATPKFKSSGQRCGRNSGMRRNRECYSKSKLVDMRMLNGSMEPITTSKRRMRSTNLHPPLRGFRSSHPDQFPNQAADSARWEVVHD